MLELVDISKITAIAEHSLKVTVEAADDAMTQAIESPIYDWPNVTIRRNGQVVGSPRNIVDTRYFIESQYVIPISQSEWEIGWMAEYADEIHEGVGNNPARPWTEQAIKGDGTAPPRYQQPTAILNVPRKFAHEFTRRL